MTIRARLRCRRLVNNTIHRYDDPRYFKHAYATPTLEFSPKEKAKIKPTFVSYTRTRALVLQ